MGKGNDGRWEVQATFFPFSVNKSFSKKKRIKSTLQYTQLFSILHVSANFHYD